MGTLGEQTRRLMAERGVSLRALARETSYDVGYLSRALNGRQTPSRGLVEAIDRALGADGALIALASESGPGDVALASDRWTQRDAGDLADMLTARAAYVDEHNAARLAHEWLITDPPQLVEVRAGRRIGEQLVAKVEARVVEVRRLDDYVGGGDLAAVVDRELTATAGLLVEAAYAEPHGRRLLVAVGELAQLAGWVHSDAGAHGTATRYYLGGVKAAHAAGDQALAANLLSSLSYQVANTGRPRDAVLLARSAACGARAVATPRTRALLADRAAWAHTKAGQQREAERALGDADDALADVRPGDPDPDWVYWVDRDELDVMAGRVYTELRRSLRAEPLLRSVLARYDQARARESALYLTWLADTYIHAGEIEQAAATAGRALQLAAQVNSARASARVDQVRRNLAPWRDTPAVQDLTEHAASAARTNLDDAR